MRILHLTLKAKFYDMISSGEKTEEYREIKPYWIKRLLSRKPWVTPDDWYPEEMCNEFNKFPESFNDSLPVFGAELRRYDVVKFARGGHFHPSVPQMTFEFKGIDVGPAKPEWSDNWPGNVFIIKLGSKINL